MQLSRQHAVVHEFKSDCARDDYRTVLHFMRLKVKVRQSSIRGYCEPGVAKRQVYTVGETLNGFSCNSYPVQLLAKMGSDPLNSSTGLIANFLSMFGVGKKK